MNKLLSWFRQLDENLVKILLVGFIFLVPLWPKLPIKMINYTYIAIRFDDIYLAILAFVFFVQLLRKKVLINRKFIFPFAFFLLAVISSYLWNSYISKASLSLVVLNIYAGNPLECITNICIGESF